MEDHTESSTGIACLWIGVGSLNPSSAKLCNKYDSHPYLWNNQINFYVDQKLQLSNILRSKRTPCR